MVANRMEKKGLLNVRIANESNGFKTSESGIWICRHLKDFTQRHCGHV